MNTYRMVRDRHEAVLDLVRGLPVDRDTYYEIRATEGGDSVFRAARFLYLNRTAFGGIYRLNREGRFNVPYGGGERTPEILWQSGLLKKASAALYTVTVSESDFEDVLERVQEGDVAYCDPTYTVAHDTNGFVRYNERNFSWADQERLARAAHMAVDRGATVLVSNAHHPTLRDLYPDANVQVLERSSLVSTDPQKRRPVSEYLFFLSKIIR